MDSKKSVDFATIMEKEFSAKAGRNSRGVKDSDDREHSLQVLKYTNMTGVLLECGFLSNEKEANYLNTTEGQDILASAIFRGIRTFLQKEYPAINFVKNAPAKPVVAATAKTTTKESKETKIPEKVPAKPTTESGAFSVQIMSSRDPIDPSDVAFRKLGEPVVRQKVVSTREFIYRYLLGNFDSREEGAVVLKKVHSNGFKDAIIIQTE
jgi:N-acetylmuramoyl-L-alanine amidase